MRNALLLICLLLVSACDSPTAPKAPLETGTYTYTLTWFDFFEYNSGLGMHKYTGTLEVEAVVGDSIVGSWMVNDYRMRVVSRRENGDFIVLAETVQSGGVIQHTLRIDGPVVRCDALALLSDVRNTRGIHRASLCEFRRIQ